MTYGMPWPVTAITGQIGFPGHPLPLWGISGNLVMIRAYCLA